MRLRSRNLRLHNRHDNSARTSVTQDNLTGSKATFNHFGLNQLKNKQVFLIILGPFTQTHKRRKFCKKKIKFSTAGTNRYRAWEMYSTHVCYHILSYCFAYGKCDRIESFAQHKEKEQFRSNRGYDNFTHVEQKNRRTSRIARTSPTSSVTI